MEQETFAGQFEFYGYGSSNSTLQVMYNQRNCRIESLKIQAWTDY